jgi:hypothetical protein
MANTCPICGYDHLKAPPYRETPKGGLGSLEICPSCGYQFGWSDHDQHITHDQWRQQWISKGMTWFSRGIKQPAGWNPEGQLLNVGVKV